MFAVAARYSEEEAPPSSDQMWEAGLFYMVQARELLSAFLPLILSSWQLCGVRLLSHPFNMARPDLSLFSSVNMPSITLVRPPRNFIRYVAVARVS